MLRQLWHPRKFLDMHCPLQVFVEFLWPVWNLNNINDLLKSRHQQYFSIRLQWRIAWRPSAFLSLVSHPFLEDPLLPERETLGLISSQEMVQLTEFMPSTWISPQAQWPCDHVLNSRFGFISGILDDFEIFWHEQEHGRAYCHIFNDSIVCTSYILSFMFHGFFLLVVVPCRHCAAGPVRVRGIHQDLGLRYFA
jgi:hypothetical protein